MGCSHEKIGQVKEQAVGWALAHYLAVGTTMAYKISWGSALTTVRSRRIVRLPVFERNGLSGAQSFGHTTQHHQWASGAMYGWMCEGSGAGGFKA